MEHPEENAAFDAEVQPKAEVIALVRYTVTPEAEEAKRAELEAKVRAEREAEEARLRAEREAEEARLAVQRAELAAREAELAELERQQRLEALKPDAEKLRAFAAEINTMTPPDVASPEARKTLADALSILQSVIGALESFGNP